MDDDIHAFDAAGSHPAIRTLAEAYLDVAEVIMVALDREGRVTLINRKGSQVLGWTAAELIGRDWFKTCIPAHCREEGRIVFARTVAGEITPVEYYENRVVTSRGAERLIAWHSVLLRDEADEIEGTLSSGIDVTERSITDESLRASEARYRSLVEHMGEGVVQVDNDDRILFVNDRLCRMLGRTRDELLGTIGYEAFSVDERGRDLIREKNRSRLAGVADAYETTMLRSDGVAIRVSISGAPLYGPKGEIVGSVGLLTDITERTRVEEALRASEAFGQAVIENSPIGISVRDRTGRLLSSNAAWRKIWAIPESVVDEDATRQRQTLAFNHRDDYLRPYQENVRSVYEHGGYLRIPELRVTQLRQGSAQWISQHFYAIQGADGAVDRVVILTEDITERKRTEERLSALAALHAALVPHRPPEEKLGLVTQMIVDQLGADFARAWMIRPGDLCDTGCVHAPISEGPHVCRFRDRCLHLIASSGRYTHLDGKIHRRVPFGCYKIGRVASGDDAKFLTNEVTTDPRVHDHDWARRLGLVSFAGYRIPGVEGEPVGVLALFSRSPITPEMDAFLEGLAHTTSQLMRAAQAEEALAKERAFTEAALDSQTDTFFVFEIATGKPLRWNKAFSRVSGYGDDEIRTLTAPDSYYRKGDLEKIAQASDEMRRTGTATVELSLVTKDGRAIPMEYTVGFIRDKGGNPLHVIAVGRDITERRRAEQEREELQTQLLQARKLESVGRLAGGVAHDFNNQLQVVLGHAEIALAKAGPAHPVRADLEEIRKAAGRSTDLTRQLLAFARKQIVSPKVVDLNEAIEGMLTMLGRLIGEDIELSWLPATDLWTIRIDPTQIVQILANLCVNARDAINGVGTVSIETENMIVDEAYCADHAGFIPGSYAMLAVTDDGCGMDREILSHIFEPFFTTKELGRGVGLGLATVYGIVRQNEGFIHVYSEPRKGTTFRIYLPRAGTVATEEPSPVAEEAPPGGSETVLLVEDDSAVLSMGRQMLEGLGYKVLTASTPEEGIRYAQEHPGTIDLLITDIVMPQMNGRALAERIAQLAPGARCVFMSGYTANVIAHRGVLEPGVRFIQKPFTLRELALAARRALEEDA